MGVEITTKGPKIMVLVLCVINEGRTLYRQLVIMLIDLSYKHCCNKREMSSEILPYMDRNLERDNKNHQGKLSEI